MQKSLVAERRNSGRGRLIRRSEGRNEASGGLDGRNKNATSTRTSSCGRLRIEEVIQPTVRGGAKGEIVRDRTCVFCLPATHVNRAAMNKRDRFFGWMKTIFLSLSHTLFFFFFFFLLSKTRIGSDLGALIARNDSWLKLENELCVHACCFVVLDENTRCSIYEYERKVGSFRERSNFESVV